MRGDLERVQLWFQEVRLNIKSFLLTLFDVFEHAERELAFDFLGAAWVESGVEGNHRAVLHEGQLDD